MIGSFNTLNIFVNQHPEFWRQKHVGALAVGNACVQAIDLGSTREVVGIKLAEGG